MAKINRVLQTSTIYLIGGLIGRAVGFLTIPLYSRFLSPAEFGIVELIELSTEIIAITLGMQAIGTAMTRIYHEQKTPEQERAVVSTSVMAAAILSSTVALIAILLAAPLSRAVFHSLDQAPLMRVAFVAMFFSYMVEINLVYQQIQERARFYLTYTLTVLFANLSLNIFFIGFAHAGVWGFLLSKLFVTVCGSCFLMFRLAREVGVKWQGSLVPEFIRFGAPLAASGAAFFIIHFSDRFFLTSAVSLADLGRYALAYRFAFLVSILIGDSFRRSWNATFYRYTEEDGWRQQFAYVATFLMFVLCLTALAVAIFAPELLRLMVPPDFYPEILLLPILVFSYVFREMGDFFRSLLLINKRSGRFSQIAVGGAAVNLTLNFLLIPRFGIFGAAVATLLTWVIYFFACWVLAKREHDLPVKLGPLALLGGLAVAIYALGETVRVHHSPVQLALDVGWVVLFGGLGWTFYFSRHERAMLIAGATQAVARLLSRGGGTGKRAGPSDGQTARLLVVAGNYPAQTGSNARTGPAPPEAGEFVRRFAAAGHAVTVIAPQAIGQEQARAYYSETDVLRVPDIDERRQSYSLWTLVIGFIQGILFPRGDNIAWVRHAETAGGVVIERENVDVMLSMGQPVAAHLAAFRLQHRFGTPWIAYIDRPLSRDASRTTGRPRLLDPFMERLVIENATAISTRDRGVADSLQIRYPELAQKVRLVEDPAVPAEDRGSLIDLIREIREAVGSRLESTMVVEATH